MKISDVLLEAEEASPNHVRLIRVEVGAPSEDEQFLRRVHDVGRLGIAEGVPFDKLRGFLLQGLFSFPDEVAMLELLG